MRIYEAYSSPTLSGIVFSDAVFDYLYYCFTVLSARIDTWVWLYARMVVILSKFNRTAQTCRKKFN